MTTTLTTLKEWQDRYMALVARIEEPVVEYAGRAAEAVAEYVPQRPDWPLLEQVPTLTDLVENQLSFRKRVVDHQAVFVRKLMKATKPVLVKFETKAPAAAATPARATKSGPRPARATKSGPKRVHAHAA